MSGSQKNSVCEEFTARQLDLCECRGHDGRPDPELEQSNNFRAERGLPLLTEKPQRTVLTTNTAGTPENKQRQWTIPEQIASVAKAALHVVANGFHPLAPEQIAERLAICQSCEFFAKQRCKLCGCGLSDKVSLTNKVAHPNQQCPHDPPKWGAAS